MAAQIGIFVAEVSAGAGLDMLESEHERTANIRMGQASAAVLDRETALDKEIIADLEQYGIDQNEIYTDWLEYQRRRSADDREFTSFTEYAKYIIKQNSHRYNDWNWKELREYANYAGMGIIMLSLLIAINFM